MHPIANTLAELSAADLESQAGWDALELACAQLEREPGAQSLFPFVFAFLERMSEADLGSPGPIVHALEALGGYEKHLLGSVARKPTPLTLWMVNRILNGCSSSERQQFVAVLAATLHHPAASEGAREAAAEFLVHQGQV